MAWAVDLSEDAGDVKESDGGDSDVEVRGRGVAD
jgi:hypothetical protein